MPRRSLEERKNEIVHLKINGRNVHGVSELKSEIRNYFAHRFSQEAVPEFDFEMEDHAKISADQSDLLEAVPSREEIKNVVWACGIDKAPGFDGYNFKFIREMWDVIQDEIVEFILEFFTLGGTVRHINITWVTLIPKIVNPQSIEDYRPISMWGFSTRSFLKSSPSG